MARSRGPNAPVGTPGGRVAQVEVRHRGQVRRWSRYSSTTARTGGTSATWCRIGSGSSPCEVVAAPAAFGRLALDDLAELLGRDQRPGVTTMAGLPAPLLARGGSRWPSLDRGGIGGGRLGGVGGVLVEPLLQVGDPPLEGLHQRRDRRLRLGRERIPDGLWERWLILHAAVLLIITPQKQQWAVNAYVAGAFTASTWGKTWLSWDGSRTWACSRSLSV